MRAIIIWLWGAGISSLWWGSIVFKFEPLVALTIIASAITLVVFGFYCDKHWKD